MFPNKMDILLFSLFLLIFINIANIKLSFSSSLYFSTNWGWPYLFSIYWIKHKINKKTIFLNVCVIAIAKSGEFKSHEQKLIFFRKTIIDTIYSKLDVLSS